MAAELDDARRKEAPVSVVSSQSCDSLTALFQPPTTANNNNNNNNNNWAGADAAYSFSLDKEKSLWMFGDTFIRAASRTAMINNSAAIQKIEDGSHLKFYWRRTSATGQERAQARSLLKESAPNTWLWPLDGAIHDGTFFEFMNVVKRSANENPAFDFQITGQQLMRVQNPSDTPDTWHYSLEPATAKGMQVGNAAFADAEYLYLYSTYEAKAKGLFKHPIVLARIPWSKLKSPGISSEFELWCHTNDGEADPGRWKKSGTHPVVLFEDGASELTVKHIRGLKGLYAVYIPSGFGNEIMLRHADRPEGPWSKPLSIYRCPLPTKDLFVYSAKAHPELSTRDGELMVTYCVNSRNAQAKAYAWQYYYPHAIRVQLKSR